MASTCVESSPELNQLFTDISLKFSPEESEDVVQSFKRIYGEQFNSLGNQDLLSCLYRLHKLGYVSNTKLTLIKEFIATKSNKEKDISDTIENFKKSHPPQAEQEKKLQGRNDEIQKITEKLQMGQPPVVNLYGSAGVGKTTLAKEVCEKWKGKSYVFDLREAKDMKTVYFNIMHTLKLSDFPVGHLSVVDIVGMIHDQIEKKREGQLVLFLLDNVELFTKGEEKDGKNLKKQFMQFLEKLSGFHAEDKTRTLNIHVLLTSRTQLNNSEKVVDHELDPLKDSFSEKILLPMETSNVNAQQKEELLGICKGVPLLLKGTAAILRQGRKSPSDLIDGSQIKSKLEEDAKEKTFDFQEEGVDEDQASLIKTMFDTLPSDSLRVSAVCVSLFCGPFSAFTAAIILGISPSEAAAQLEGLVTNEIIYVVNQEATELMYDIHQLLRKYADSITSDAKFCESYTEAMVRFREHFMPKVKMIAGFIESDYVKAFNLFAIDRPNYEFAIDISLLPGYFNVPGKFHEFALFASLYNAMLSGEKQTELFHSWAEMCKDDGKSGSLFRAQLRCWEARQVLDVDGTDKAFKVLQQASLSLEQVQDQSTESFKLTQGLFLYFEGEIHCQNRDYKKAIKCLKSSLDLMEEPLKLDTNLARCYNAIGNCYYRLDKPEKALEFYNKALKMREELSGSEYHYDMPVYKNQIGTVHEDQGEYDKAVECYKDALRLLEELQISGYEDEALFCRNLANVYVRKGKYREAIEPAEKAYNIRMKLFGEHPDTVLSIFQQGVIQANLQAFEKALDFFLKAWEMEKSLQLGNRSEVWRLIIIGVNDMCDCLNKNNEKEEFKQDALEFCQRFWKEEKGSAQFSFTEYNKNIIDTILFLLGNEKKDRALRDEYEKAALWFYDEMHSSTEEDFYNDFDQETDNKVLNEMLKTRNEFLDKIIDLCGRHDQHDKLKKHKRNKLTLYNKVLERLNFVGEKKGHKKATLKDEAEKLYKDLGEKGSIRKFRENLLEIWQKQWEEGKAADETKEMLVLKERTIKGILQLCKELKKEELHRRYGKEDLRFGERLWKVKHTEMKVPTMKAFLKEMKDLASSIGDRERVMVYHDALQTLSKTGKLLWATLVPKESQMLQVEKTPLYKHGPATSRNDSEEEIEIEVGSEQEIEVVSEEIIEVESEEVIEVESDEIILEESWEVIEVESEEETEVGGGFNVVNSRSVFKDTVTKQGAHWNLKQVAAHVIFPPDAVSEDKTVTVVRWNPLVCSPPVQDNEALVSDVIELSTDGPEGLEFSKPVTLVISHCAADLKGYEVVVKQLIDRDSNEWDDILETVDLGSLADVMKSIAFPSDVPDYLLPVAETKITQCSTFVVCCRLKSNKFTITSQGRVLTLPEYPLFSVTIPENAIQGGEELLVTIKLQEIPQQAVKGKEVLAGPILRMSGSRSVTFQEPVTIQLPLSLREGQTCNIPDLSLIRVRILFQESGTEHREWTEITNSLETPPSCDGTVIKFSVKHSSGFQGDAYFDDLEVQVISRGKLTVEFCRSKERDEDKRLCEMEVTLPPPSSDDDRPPVEFFGVPVNDRILLQASDQTPIILALCRGFLQDKDEDEKLYKEYLHRFTKIETPAQVLASFFEALAGQDVTVQEKCFDAIVNKLRRETVSVPLAANNEVIRNVSQRVGIMWKRLARELELGAGGIDNISAEEQNDEERCYKALQTWCQMNGEHATIRKLMIALTKTGLAEMNNDIMGCLNLLS